MTVRTSRPSSAFRTAADEHVVSVERLADSGEEADNGDEPLSEAEE